MKRLGKTIADLRSTLWVRKLYRQRWLMAIRNYAKYVFPRVPQRFPEVDDRGQLDLAEKVIMTWPENCPKPRVGLVRDRQEYPYWTKFERFLINNQIPFEYYEAHLSNWLEKAGQFDVILWITEWAEPHCLDEVRRKTYILEKLCGKVCFPSFYTHMWNEDKLTQYELLRLNNLPVVETFISHDLAEILQRSPQLEYPLVAKSSTGAGSMAVELVKDSQQAEKISKTIFSTVGRTTFLPYFRQKDYVYFQKFQPNEGYDLRIIVVGDIIIGYYRDVPKGEFRASGMHNERFEALPEDAMKLAREVARKLDEVVIAVDMLRDPRDGKLYITEMAATSCFDILGDLKIDGVNGIYVFNPSGEYRFQPGNYWSPELILREFFGKKWFPKFKSNF